MKVIGSENDDCPSEGRTLNCGAIEAKHH